MMLALSSKPWTFARHARLLAELHFKVTSARVQGLPSQREKLDRYIRAADALPQELKEQALRLLESLPDGGALCHGDLHPDNVILSPRGPVIIDWPDAGSGAPLADVARTVVLMKFGALAVPDILKRTLFQALGGFFLGSYVGRYMRLSGADRRELQKWVVVSAAARVETGIPEEKQALLKFVARGLAS
jgi:aminoglycoside phosphotransferase (APT) family kinase protein